MLDFPIFMKEAKRYLQENVSNPDLFDLLLGWVIDKETCYNAKGKSFVFDDGDVSKILNGKKSLPKNLAKEASRVDIDKITYYLKEVILKYFCEDHIDDFVVFLKDKLSEGKPLTSKQKELLAETDNVIFLAKTLRFLVTLPTKSKSKLESNAEKEKNIINKNHFEKFLSFRQRQKEIDPLDFIYENLDDFWGWERRETEDGTFYHNKHFPEYRIAIQSENLKTYENCFYGYSMLDHGVVYETLTIIANGTTLEEHSSVSMDGGRLKILSPDDSSIEGHIENRYFLFDYCSYDMDSKKFDLMNFLSINPSSDEADYSFDCLKKVIVIYKSAHEHKAFEEYVKKHIHILDMYIEKVKPDYSWIKCAKEINEDYIKQQLTIGKALNMMLENWRKREKNEKEKITRNSKKEKSIKTRK